MKLAQNCLVASGWNWLTTVFSGERIALALDCVQWWVDKTGSVLCPMLNGWNRLSTVPNCERMELALNCPVMRRYHSFKTASNGELMKLAQYYVQWWRAGTGSELSTGEWMKLAHYCVQWWMDRTGSELSSGEWTALTEGCGLGEFEAWWHSAFGFCYQGVCVCVCVHRLLTSNSAHDTAPLYNAATSRSPFQCDNFFTTCVTRDSVTAGRRRYQLAFAWLQSDTWSVYCRVENVQCPYILTVLSKSQLVGRCLSVQFPLTESTVGKFWYINYR